MGCTAVMATTPSVSGTPGPDSGLDRRHDSGVGGFPFERRQIVSLGGFEASADFLGAPAEIRGLFRELLVSVGVRFEECGVGVACLCEFDLVTEFLEDAQGPLVAFLGVLVVVAAPTLLSTWRCIQRSEGVDRGAQVYT